MGWRFWSRDAPQEEAPPPTPPRDLTAPELDLNALFTDPPRDAAAPPGQDPAWMDRPDPEVEALTAHRDDYTRVDLGELKRQREKRERGQRFWARLRRGDLSTRDIPGQESASGALFRLMEFTVSPIRAIAENPFLVLAVIGTAIGFAAAAKGLLEVVRHYVTNPM